MRQLRPLILLPLLLALAGCFGSAPPVPKARAVKQAARRAGMTTLREDAISKLLAGLTTIEEVMALTTSDD